MNIARISPRSDAIPVDKRPRSNRALSHLARRLVVERLEDRRLLAVLFSHDAGDTVRAISPSESAYNNFGLDWIGGSEPFDDSAWSATSGGANGIGYDRGSVYDSLLGLDVESSMHGASSTLFARAEFNVADPSAVDGLTFSLRYDDGFIAWLNGIEVARANADSVYPAWSATATAAHQASTTAFETFDLAAAIASLQTGTNVLAIRGLNLTAADDDALIQFTLVGESRTGPPLAVNDAATAQENTPVFIDVLANDEEGSDPIDASSVAIATPPAHGTAVANPDGTITYTPITAYNGPDSFTYTVRDNTGTGATESQTLVASNAAVRAFVPANNNLGTTWRGADEPFNDTGWQSGTLGVGYDTNASPTDFTPQISLNVRTALQNVNTTIYMRSAFSIADRNDVLSLTLRMRYDDGFVAFINGVQVASAFAPSSLTYNSASAGETRPDADALVFQSFNLSPFLSALKTGPNVLAIHGLNQSLGSSDLLMQPELVATVDAGGRQSNAATVSVTVTGVDFPPIARNDTYSVDEGKTLIVSGGSGTTLTPGPGQVLWPVSAGGNGHVYESVEISDLTWPQARALAESRSLSGVYGRLATVTSAAELAFLSANLPAMDSWLGGYQDFAAPGYSEPSGGWRWITGEPWQFTNWESSEPNDAAPGESYLDMFGGGGREFQWNDARTDQTHNVMWVEYSPGLAPEPTETVLIAANEVWQFRDNGVVPPNDAQGDSWKQTAFDDSGWAAGAAQLGYGDGDERTVVDCGSSRPSCNSNNHITTWFRKHFTLEPGIAARATALMIELMRDDAAAVYINGVELIRSNLPGVLGDNAVTAQTLASAVATTADESTFQPPETRDLTLPQYRNLLRDGDNVIAVEVHQNDVNSTDITFDLRMSLTVAVSGGVLGNDTEPDGQAMTAVLGVGPVHGTLDFYPNGTFAYTPDPLYYGPDSFTYRATDGLLTSDPATVTITVIHAAPTAAPDTYATDESTPLVVAAAAGVLSNDVDTLGHTLTASVVTTPAHGSLTLNPNGSFTYTPTSGYNGTDTFTYAASDGQRSSAPATVTITLRAINTPPVAVNDTFAVAEGATFGLSHTGVVKVLGTGFDDATSAKLVNAATDSDYLIRSGSVTAAGIPAFVARSGGPSAWLSDGASSNSAWISVGLGDRAIGSYFYDTTVFVPGGDASSVRLGNLRYAADNKLVSIFVNSIEVFTQTIGDAAEHGDFRSLGNLGTGAFLPGANTIRFEVYNSGGPTAFRVEGVVEFDPSATPSVLANDSDVDTPTLTARTIDLPTNGTLLFDANGKFRYTPNPGFVGVDTFTYVANDGASDSNVATVTMNVGHSGPAVTSDAYAVDEDTLLDVNAAQGVLANDNDSQGHAMTAVLDHAPAHGSLNLREDGSFTYTPAANYYGTDSFQYRASDGTLTSLPVTVQLSVSAVADAPLAADDRYEVLEGQTLVVDGDWGQPVVLLPGMFQWNVAQGGNGHVYQRISGARNWHDARRDAESRTLGPTAGHLATITSAAERSFLAVLGENEHWLGGFQDTQSPLYVEPAGGWKWITGEPWAYTSWQGGEPNNTGEEFLSGGGAHEWNDLPNVHPAAEYWVEFPVNEPIRYDPLVPQGATWRYRDDGANLGTAWRLPRYTDSSWASGPAQLGYGEGDEATVTFGGAPSARFATTFFRHDFNVTQLDHIKALTLDVLRDDGIAVYLNGTQILRNNLSANAAFNQFASTSASDDGQVWQPFAGIDPALLRPGLNTIAVEVHASGASDTDLSFDLRLTALRAYNPPILDNDTDVDGIPPRVATLVAGPSNGVLTFSTSGIFSYRPNDGFFGVDTFTYRASDGSLLSEPATVTIHVIHPAPTAGNDTYATNEDWPLDVTAAMGLLANDVDTQGHPLSITIAGPPAHGVLTLQTDGSFSYIPTDNFHGTDSFTYFVSDGEQASELATVTITIHSVNDVPEAGDDDYSIDRGTSLQFAAAGTAVETIAQTSFAEPATGSVNYAGGAELGFTASTTPSATELGVLASDQYIVRGVASPFTLNFEPVDISAHRQVTVRIAVRTHEDSAGSDFEDIDYFRAYLGLTRIGGPVVLQTIVDLNGVELKALDTGLSGTFAAFSANIPDGFLTATLTIETSVDSTTERVFFDDIVFEGISVAGGNILLSNDTDDDGDPLSVRIVSQPTHGVLETDNDGAMTYTPDPLFIGTDTFTYVANDGVSDSNVATVTVHVLLANLVPTAANDSYSISEVDKLIVSAASGVLANDIDLDGDVLTIRVVEGPAHGSLSTLPNGAFHYTPTANYSGPDAFKYVATDGRDDSTAATVSISVTAVNDAPATNRDVYTIGAGETLDATIQEGDGVFADSIAEFSGVQGQLGWYYGYYNRTTDGDGIYQPANFTQFPRGAGAWSSTNFWDAASNRWKWFGGSPPWTEVLANNVHPNGTNNGQEHWAIRRWVSDVEGPATIIGHLAKLNTGGGDGVRGIIYVDGVPIYNQTIAGGDGQGVDFRVDANLTAGAIVDVVLTPNGNDAQDGTYFNVSIYSASSAPSTLALVARNATWRYRDNITNGSAYPVDGQGDRWNEGDYDDTAWPSGPAILGYDNIVAGPVATTIEYGGNPNDRYRTTLFRRTFDVAAADRVISLDFDTLIDDGAAIYINGREVLRLNLPGTRGDATLRTDTLAPSAGNESSYVSFSVDLASFPGLLVDGTNTIAVEVHQTTANSSDLGFDLEVAATSLPDPAAGGVLGNDSDAEGDEMTATVIAGPFHGTLAFQNNGTFRYTPSIGFEGVDQFTYRASDGAAEAPATLVTINVGAANRPPLAADDRFVARGGRSLNISAASGVLKNDFDFNGDDLAVAVFALPTRGTLALAADGGFVYTPQSNFLGVDSFTYRVADAQGTFGFATATIQVVLIVDPINGIPVAAADVFDATAGGVLSVAAPGVLANDHDPELRPLTAVVDGAPWHGSLSFAADGSFTYTPTAGFSGADTFTYRATDGNTFSAPATVVINVSAAVPAGGVSLPTPPSLTPSGSTQLPGSQDSTSLPGTLPTSGDLNGDGRVDRADLAIVAAAYGASSATLGYYALADLNGDGRVSIADAIALRNRMSDLLQPASSNALVRRASDRLANAPSQIDAIAVATPSLRTNADMGSPEAGASPLRVARSKQPRLAIARRSNDLPAEAVDHVLGSDAGSALVARRTRTHAPGST